MNKIRELRIEKGLTQSELGNVLSVQKSAVSKYELGRATPSPDVLKKLSDYFDVSIDYLLGKSDTRKIESPDTDVPADEAQLLGNYRKLNELGKENARLHVAGLTTEAKYTSRIKDKAAI